MIRLLILPIILISYVSLWSQSNLDSLYAIWIDTTKPDSSRTLALQDVIYEGYYYGKPDSALLLATKLYAFTKEVKDSVGMVDALDLTGYIYFRMGEYPQALISYKEGLQVADLINDQEGTAAISLKIGFIYHDNEDLVTALRHYQKSLKIYQAIDDLEGIGSVYNEFGSIYRAEREYAKSLDYYERSLAINAQLGDEDQNSAMLANIGQLYLDQGDFTKALDYLEQGLAIYRRLGDKLGIASGLSGVGAVYGELGDNAKALEVLQRSLSISDEIDDAQGAATTLVDIGDIYANQGQYAASIKHCKKSLELAQHIGDLGNQMSACECLYVVAKAKGKMGEALSFHEQMMLLNDSLQSEQAAKELQQMEFSKEVQADSMAQVERDMEISMAHREELQRKDRNRNVALGAGLFFLLLAGAFFSRWRYVKRSKAIIEKEKERSDNLLLNILPAEIAEELKEKGEATARDFDLVSILFTDFKGFTEKSAGLSATELINEVNDCFRAFDLICEKYRVEKIKTIGDAYMAAGGLPVPSDASVRNTVLAALEMQAYIAARLEEKTAKRETAFEMRLGIHTGPVVAGIVGVKKFQYDVWGDTVNTASRMESNGEIGKVNVSHDSYQKIKDDPIFNFEARGKIRAKGKGEIEMWFVERAK